MHERSRQNSAYSPSKIIKNDTWQRYGGLETLVSYDAAYLPDWMSKIPQAHWGFLERTLPFLETETHIFVHACLDPELEMSEQPDWLLYWEYFERLQPHKSGKRVICGHTPQPSGTIGNRQFAACIDTAAVYGGWLTCLDVVSGRFWQTNEKGETREGTV